MLSTSPWQALPWLYEIRTDRASPLSALEGLRGFSVILVFCVHLFGWLLFVRSGISPDNAALRDFTGANLLLAWLSFSHHGVHIFFVLSGFLIGRMLQRPGFELATFLRHRCIRIYPAFLLSLAIAVVFRVAVIGDMPLSASLLIENVLLLNGIPALGTAAYNPVTWSLFNELAFYALIGGAYQILGRQVIDHWWRLIALALVAVFLPFVVGYVDARFLLFFVGVWIAGRDDAELRSIASSVPTSYVVAFYLFASNAWPLRIVEYGTSIFLFGLAAVLLVVKCCYDEGPLRSLATWAPLRWLGNISYSFYLLHAIVIGWFAHAWSPLPSDMRAGSIVMVACAAFVVSWIAATLSFVVAERRYFVRRRARLRSRPDFQIIGSSRRQW